MGLLISIVNTSNHTKCVLLSNLKCMILPTLIHLHPNEFCQEFHHYPFAVKLDRCVGKCNNLYDLSNKAGVPNKTEDLNLGMFNMVTEINQLKTLTKHILCECKYRFDERKCYGGRMINVDFCVRNVLYVEKSMFGILQHVIVKMENI